MARTTAGTGCHFCTDHASLFVPRLRGDAMKAGRSTLISGTNPVPTHTPPTHTTSRLQSAFPISMLTCTLFCLSRFVNDDVAIYHPINQPLSKGPRFNTRTARPPSALRTTSWCQTSSLLGRHILSIQTMAPIWSTLLPTSSSNNHCSRRTLEVTRRRLIRTSRFSAAGVGALQAIRRTGL